MSVSSYFRTDPAISGACCRKCGQERQGRVDSGDEHPRRTRCTRRLRLHAVHVHIQACVLSICPSARPSGRGTCCGSSDAEAEAHPRAGRIRQTTTTTSQSKTNESVDILTRLIPKLKRQQQQRKKQQQQHHHTPASVLSAGNREEFVTYRTSA